MAIKVFVCFPETVQGYSIFFQDKVRHVGMLNSRIYANSRGSPKTKEKRMHKNK